MRTIRVLVMAAILLAAISAPGALAQVQGVRLTTPYPAVAVEPGATTSFDLEVSGPAGTRVDLAVTQRPEGWRTTIRGGGFVVDGVTASAKEPPAVDLEVEVPADARRGLERIVVTATSSAGSDTLELDLRVAKGGGGGVQLETEFPALEGPADATYTFSVNLVNNVPQETTFAIEALGPEGWQIDARPTGQQQAATVQVGAGESTTIDVSADPPEEVVAGAYPIEIRASGGGNTATLELEVTITGTYRLTLTTPDERLTAEVAAGGSATIPVIVFNDGSAPVTAVQLTATPPAGWEVDFRPAMMQEIPAGGSARAQATITPSQEAVAGDYVVSMTASVPETTSSVDIRTTVQTSSLWGVVGILLIVAALGGLGWVFRRYGRR